jgi:hypothetical protein
MKTSKMVPDSTEGREGLENRHMRVILCRSQMPWDVVGERRLLNVAQSLHLPCPRAI